MRKLLLFSALLSMAVTVSGCGAKTAESGDTETQAAVASEDADTQAVEHTPFALGGHCVVVLVNNGYDVAQSARDCSEEALVQFGQQSPDWGQFTDGAYAATTCIYQRGVGQCDPYDYGY